MLRLPSLINFLLICTLLLSTPASAQSVAELDALKSQLRDTTSAAQRLQIVEQLLRTRRTLIGASSSPVERSMLLADQASDILFFLLPQNAMGLEAMFGLPQEHTLTRARAAVQEMASSAEACEQALFQAIQHLENAADFKSDMSLQQQWRNLTEVERDRRVPMLRGIAAALEGEIVPTAPPEKSRYFSTSVQTLNPLLDRLEDRALLQARLHLALANIRLSRFDEAEQLLVAAAKSEGIGESDLFMARMLGVINRAARNGPLAGIEALDSIERHYAATDAATFYFRLLIADQRALLHAAAGQVREQLIAYLGLWRSDSSIPREALQATVIDRMSRSISVDSFDPSQEWPGLVLIGYAERYGRDQHTRGRAIEWLEDALRRNRFDAESTPTAGFTLARLLAEHHQPMFAARRFIDLAANFPSHFLAPRAVEAGVAIAANVHRRMPKDAEAAETYRNGLHLLVTRFPSLPTINRWRLEAANLALAEERPDDAIAFAAEIVPNASESIDAQFVAITAQRMKMLRTNASSEAESAFIQSTAKLSDVLAQRINLLSDSNRIRALDAYRHWLQVYRAEALLRLHQPVAAFEALSGYDNSPDLDPALLGALMKVRMDAHLQAREPAKATAAIQRFVSIAPERAAETLLPVMQSLQREIESASSPSKDSVQMLLAVAETLHKTIDAAPADLHIPIQLQTAEAFRIGDRCLDALPLYDSVLEADSTLADAVFGKAECLFALGTEKQLAIAIELYKRLTAAGPLANPHHYWMSQLRSLQILDRMNRSTHQILPRIEQLRQIDRDFGGERYRAQFETLRRKYVSN